MLQSFHSRTYIYIYKDHSYVQKSIDCSIEVLISCLEICHCDPFVRLIYFFIYVYICCIVDVKAEHGTRKCWWRIGDCEGGRVEKEGVRFDADADSLGQSVDAIQSSGEYEPGPAIGKN